MKKHSHSHVNYCPMSRVDDIGKTRVKSCPGKSIRECEQDCPENDCEITSTDIICDNYECQITKQLDEYKSLIEDVQAENAKLKATNTQFRVLMLMPTMAEKAIEDGKMDFSGIRGLITRQRPSWHSLNDTTILYMLEYHQKYAEAYSEFAHERNSKIKIKELVADKGRLETIAAASKLDAAKREAAEKKAEQKKKEAKEKSKLTDFQKNLEAFKKIGMKEEAARAQLLAMGLKEE